MKRAFSAVRQLKQRRHTSELVRALKTPDVQAKFASQAVDIIASSPAEFADFIKEEVATNEKLVKAANIQPE
jgi:tripartite-type tricarboxylate transporter receptor subunit TctC